MSRVIKMQIMPVEGWRSLAAECDFLIRSNAQHRYPFQALVAFRARAKKGEAVSLFFDGGPVGEVAYRADDPGHWYAAFEPRELRDFLRVVLRRWEL